MTFLNWLAGTLASLFLLRGLQRHSIQDHQNQIRSHHNGRHARHRKHQGFPRLVDKPQQSRARLRRTGVASPIAEMPPGRNPRYRKSNSELLAGSDLGKNGRFFDDADVVQLLREAVDREGSISAFAKRAGLHRIAVNSILNGRRPVSQPLVKALGLRKVYVAE
jgi:hypothetical protein